MKWSEIRAKHPDQWVVVEVCEAHTTKESKRALDDLAVIEVCKDGMAAFEVYRTHHSEYPDREYLYLHTSNAEPEVFIERWLGVRIPLASHV